ncbi:MAG: DNA mismatch repair endonuclease MutL [Oligoflexia bacterium]
MRIERLSPRVAEQIAAGEVIERPAAVVKELLENSLDAGATEVAVTLRDGGKALIEVIDNGHGINVQDLPLALARHATSKLRSIEDLESLRTLGFRGEALASIGAVSRLTVLSRPPDSAAQAHSISLDHSTLELSQAHPEPATFGHFLGSPHGTRIRSEGLFSQIPARLKFLKSAGSELSAVREWMERLALAHPAVGFRLYSDDKTVLNLRPQSQEQRVREIVAEGEDFPIRTAESQAPGLKLKVYWVQGMSLAHTRNLIQLVNGRALRDRLIQQAMLGPFRQALLPGKFPAACAFLEVDPREIDVNVHPTKTEIRFLESRKLFSGFDQALGGLVRDHGSISYVASPLSSDVRTAPQPGFILGASETLGSQPPIQSPSLGLEEKSINQGLHPALAGFTPSQFLGVLFRTYLAFDIGDELGLVDQHAAHERIRFEALKARALKRASSKDSQALLIPEVARFDPSQQSELEPRLSLLSQLGFEAEIFGPGQLLFRAIPPEWTTNDLRVRLKNLIDRLLSLELAVESSRTQTQTGESLLLDEKLFEKLASEACRSSIRAGDRLEAWGAATLIQQLSRCEHPWNCPHGRPTVTRVPRARFEEWFQRTV